MSNKFLRASLMGATALTAALALAGCSLLNTGAARDDDGAIVETASEDVFAIQVGDCLNEPDGDSISEVEVVPCADAHDYEIYAETELPEGDFPADLEAQGDDFCIAEFESFVGTAYAESALDYTFFMPSQDGWENLDDRVIQCIVYDPSGETEGTLAGANR